MILTFACWVKAIKCGTFMWGISAAFSCFYMMASWGGYVFIINVIAIHTLGMIISGRCDLRKDARIYYA